MHIDILLILLTVADAVIGCALCTALILFCAFPSDVINWCERYDDRNTKKE